MKVGYWFLGSWLAAVAWAVLFVIPPAEGLGDWVRIAYFHIPAAWVSVLAFLMAAYWSCRYLLTRDMHYDWQSSAAVSLGMIFCLLATLSGAVFARQTWGHYWNWDPRQTTIAILLLIYGAYLVLRLAVEDVELRARLCAVYGAISALTVPALVFVIPRSYYSLHPEPVLNASGRLDMDPLLFAVLLAALAGASALFFVLLQWQVQRSSRRLACRKELIR